jgi:phosphoenolpyruvate carboxykinase (ATP)
MQNFGMPGEYKLEHHGLYNLKAVFWNLTPSALIEQIILRQEAVVSETGAIVVSTGRHTGRSPNDKFITQYVPVDEEICWGKVNQPIHPEKFQLLLQKVGAYLQGKDIFVQDLQVGAHPDHHYPIRIITEKAWGALFSHNLFVRVPADHLGSHRPEITVIHCPDFNTNPEEDGTNSGTVVAIDFHRCIILIAGTSYAGEIKKSIFTAMNYWFPRNDILSMHCSANVGKSGDVALFFGLSGTGKTTLSSDPDRRLIGDDEHGWAKEGVFNFEGGCYAKTIHLRRDLEPLIWEAAHRFGAVLENVTCDLQTRKLDFDDDHRTENTRGAYPIYYVPNYVPEGFAGQPQNIFFLTADAFGVLPPISRLSYEQALYYFLSGYTSKLAGTETGLGAEPQATFSTCFGAPFLPLHPRVYSELLGALIQKNKVHVWLVNTGWTGGPYGVGQRIRLPFTRAMICSALSGDLEKVTFHLDEVFGLEIPDSCPGVPNIVLNPKLTWTSQEAYHKQAELLISGFNKNFGQFAGDVSSEVVKSGPHVNRQLLSTI